MALCTVVGGKEVKGVRNRWTRSYHGHPWLVEKQQTTTKYFENHWNLTFTSSPFRGNTVATSEK